MINIKYRIDDHSQQIQGLPQGTTMLIPDPESLMKTVQSINRKVEDREWKQYQRYLSKHKKKYGDPPSKPPISFREFIAWLRYFEKDG